MQHFLVISGPGGSGKSTFIAMLASARLPADLRRLLPPDVKSWPSRQPDRSERGVRSLLATEKVILHYDIAARLRREETWAADPVLAGLQAAAKVTVVDIRPPPERVLDQVLSRAAEADAQRGWARRLARRLALRYVLRPRKRDRVKRFPSKVSLYRQAGWLEACYAEWDDFLQTTLASRKDVQLIRVEPVPDPDGSPSFKVVHGRSAMPQNQ